MNGAPPTLKIGLRFSRSQARLLRHIAARINNGELGKEHATLFEQAADAASTGEPLIVACSTPMEATLIVEGFVRFGVKRPAVEELNSHHWK